MDENYLATPLSYIPLNTNLPFPIYVKIADKMICLRTSGDSLTAARVSAMAGKLDTVYIPKCDWTSFIEQLEQSFKSEKTDPAKSAKNIHSLLLAYSKLMEQMREVQRANVAKFRILAYDLVDIAEGDMLLTQRLLQKYRDASIYYANHNVNVALYSLAIGRKIGITTDELKHLVFSALVHNIGYALIPHAILYKKESLNAEEWKTMKGHTYQGGELLEYLDVPTEVALVARQHHEHIDGKGYPSGLQADEIHLFSRICSIADVYDALTSQKPYGNPPCSPIKAIATMQEMEGKFDDKILNMMGHA
jgi:HD-GYP domain-containing protein (c-di-GMP phosphodiesterase class II)